MPRKTLRDRFAAWRASDEKRALERGERFRLSWTAEPGGVVLYFPSIAAAEAKRDAMIAEHEKELPGDYHERPASVSVLRIEIHERSGAGWTAIADSRRECVFGVKFHDAPHSRRRS